MTGCLAPRHDAADPAPAEPAAYLCRPCRRGLHRDLTRLPGLHADLEHLLVTHRPGARGDGSGLPVNEPASDCRSQIRHDITWWARRVTAIRGTAAPPVPAGDWPAEPLAVMCAWLAQQVTWCSFRDWAGELAGAAADNRARAVALVDPWVTRRFDVRGPDGRCPECGDGVLRVTVYASEADRRRSHVECGACGTRWEPERWMRLGKRIVSRRRESA